MNIPLKVSKDFERTMSVLSEKYGEDFEIMNGFHETQLDYSEFINSFVDKKVADVTIDTSANAYNKDIRSLISEKAKSHDKLFAFNKIFYELKKEYGIKAAKQWLELEYNGAYYLHDAHTATFLPYCYAYDLSRLAKEGLFFLKNYNSQPPNHLTTFLDDVIEYISFMSNRSSGAVGLPNILVWTYYFWKKDCETGYFIKDPDYYIRQHFQKLIYRLNQPFMRIDQSAFTNVSIFDRDYIESLFGGMEYPDGTFLIDYIDEFIEHQKIFMDVVSSVRSENMFTFPVLTYSLVFKDGKFKDEEFARWCSDHNLEWNDSNFFMHEDANILSNCPLDGDTGILYWSDYYNKFISSSIEDVYRRCERDKKEVIQVLQNGKKIHCKINKFSETPNYQIRLVNGAVIKTTSGHLNKVYGKDYVKTSELTTDDYLPYYIKEYNDKDLMTYEEGKLVGMFLGDGSYKDSSSVVFSLNRDSKIDCINFVQSYCQKRYGAVITESDLTSSMSGKSSCVNLVVNSSYLRGLIEQCVNGRGSIEKQIDLRVLNYSVEFRKGIIDGLYSTDGGNSNRIYTSSSKLKDSLIVVFSSLGIVTNITEDSREGRLSSNTCYTIRWYSPDKRKCFKDVYIIDDDYMWVKIKSIDVIDKNKKSVSYCLEVIDESLPEFMLANGIVTHNCRLLSDTSKLSGFINSIGGTALSIGSVKVNTMNLMRIAIESGKNKEKFLSLLRDRTLLNCKVLKTIRHIVKRNIEKGLLPNYQDGGVELDKQYMTIGILGLFEAVEHFGFIQKDEFGNSYYTNSGINFASSIFETINEIKDNFTNEFSMNVESVPAEKCAVVLCQKDNLMYSLNEKSIYSNQWIPLSEKSSFSERLNVCSVFDPKCSGGSILHLNIDNNFPNTDVAWDMLNHIANSGVIYFAFNTKINECKNHHGFIGTNTCPNCGESVYDTYQRIVGFLVPSRAYSKDRFKEFKTRHWYDYAESLKG